MTRTLAELALSAWAIALPLALGLDGPDRAALLLLAAGGIAISRRFGAVETR